jgi:hypothetical protein
MKLRPILLPLAKQHHRSSRVESGKHGDTVTKTWRAMPYQDFAAASAACTPPKDIHIADSHRVFALE